MSVLIKLNGRRKPYVAAGEATEVVVRKPVVADHGRGDARIATYVKKPAGEKVEKDWRAEGFTPLTDWLAGERDLPPVLVATDDPLSLDGQLNGVALVAIDFAKFSDGRGLSSAVLLRKRLGYGGELRAVGDVLHDQLFFMQRVGFDSYALKDDKNALYAIEAGFSPFSDAYQTSTTEPQP